MRALFRRPHSSLAQSMVEFALIVPLLFLLILGIIEMGYTLFVYTSVQNAAREGARAGAVRPCATAADTSAIIAATRSRLPALVDTSTINPNIAYSTGSAATADYGSIITVTVDYSFDLLDPLTTSLIPHVNVNGVASRSITMACGALTSVAPTAVPTPTSISGGLPTPTNTTALVCIVPSMVGSKVNSAAAAWGNAGFTGSFSQVGGNGNWDVALQTLSAGATTSCSSSITVYEAIPTSTPTNSPTATITSTPSNTPTASATSTPSNTPTAVPTNTPTVVPTNTSTAVPTNTPIPTNTPTTAPTNTPKSTAAPTNTPKTTTVPTNTPINLPTNTPNPTATNSPTNSPTASATSSPTNSPTVTNTSTATVTSSPTNSPTATSTATSSPTATATSSPTITPTPCAGPAGAPTSLSATVTGTGSNKVVHLTWSGDALSVKYKVFQVDQNGTTTSLGFTTSTAVDDSSVANNKTYQYYVVAYNACDQLGGQSSTVSVKT